MAKKDLKYTIGLDIGTNSVGWAVIDENFNLVQGKKRINDNGKIRKSRANLWGVRLFEEGQVAADRRLKRGQRRRIARRKERLNYLRGIFEVEMMKMDESFFIRLDESFYKKADKKATIFKYRDKDGILQTKTVEQKSIVKYPLFKTEAEEKTYYEDFPTIYHLRKALFDSKFIRKDDGSLKFGFDENGNADIRLVYLGIHHILKYRGHFTNQGQEFNLKNINIAEKLAEVLEKFEAINDYYFGVSNLSQEAPNRILSNRNWSRSKKAFELNQYFEIDAESVYRPENDKFIDEYESLTEKQKDKFIESRQKQLKALFTAIVGNSIDLKALFANDEYKPSEANQIPKGGDLKYGNENFDEKIGELDGKILPEELEVVSHHLQYNDRFYLNLHKF